MQLRPSLAALALAAVVAAIVLACHCPRRRSPWPVVEPFADESKLCRGVYFRELPGFLSPAECDALVAAAERRGLKPSEVGGASGGPGSLNLDIRVSDQTWFAPGEHPVSDKVRRKNAELLAELADCLPPGSFTFEHIQVARYGKGGKYDPHHDGDDCGPDAGKACPRDQRLTTLLVYLSEPEAGGATKFPMLGKAVAPEKGKALFFWVSDPASRELFEKSLHAGTPVERGTKWICTSWTRGA